MFEKLLVWLLYHKRRYKANLCQTFNSAWLKTQLAFTTVSRPPLREASSFAQMKVFWYFFFFWRQLLALIKRTESQIERERRVSPDKLQGDGDGGGGGEL